MPAQQSVSAVQAWPEALQVVHVPIVSPVGRMQRVPAQQSASCWQELPDVHVVGAAHTKGGVPDGFGTQGVVSQQFALDAQAPPVGTHAVAVQRATPPSSGLHVSTFRQFPLQQSHDALQLCDASLHTSPSGSHPWGTLQNPVVAGGVIAHVTGVPLPPGRPALPQQSLSCVHESPVT